MLNLLLLPFKIILNLICFVALVCSIITGCTVYYLTANHYENEAIEMGYGVYKNDKIKLGDSAVYNKKTFYWYDQIDHESIDKEVREELKKKVADRLEDQKKRIAEYRIEQETQKLIDQERTDRYNKNIKLRERIASLQRKQNEYMTNNNQRAYDRVSRELKTLQQRLRELGR